MNMTIANILTEALAGKQKNTYRQGELPRRAEAVNVGYLTTGETSGPRTCPLRRVP